MRPLPLAAPLVGRRTPGPGRRRTTLPAPNPRRRGRVFASVDLLGKEAVVFRILAALHHLAGALVALVVLALLGTAGWMMVRSYLDEKWERQRLESQLAQSQAQIQSLHKEVQRLQTAITLLKVDHRVAQIDVLSQHGSAKSNDLVTTFRFTELDGSGKPLEKPRVFTIQGDVVYVDALVVKWEDESVEAGDPLRSATYYLFRRIFGEAQQPKDGFPLDPVGAQPAPYRSGREPSEFERDIWARFWEYANNPSEAKKKNIRAAHGEAPYCKLVPGKRYTIELRASGGLTVKTEDIPTPSVSSTL